MPNWCENKLKITGNEEELNTFKKQAVKKASVDGDSEVLYFYNFFVENEGEVNRDWQENHFGVKWGCSFSVLTEDSDNKLAYTFGTPWNPPIEFIKHISTMFRSLTFELEYTEVGCQLSGALKMKNGEIFESHYKCNPVPEWVKELCLDI